MNTILFTIAVTAIATALAVWLYVIGADAAERRRRRRRTELEERRRKEDARLESVYRRELAVGGAR